MLTIEEYISQRKREDQLNEFSVENRIENIKKCIDFVFEYFNQYLDTTKIDEQTVLNNERLEKYQKTLANFDPEIQDWLVDIYYDHGKQLNRSIIHFLKKDELFYVYNSESEFRSMSYECYAHLINKNPFLKNQTEMLFLFIKDFHHIESNLENALDDFFISDEINNWVNNTRKKHKVNVIKFASDWINRFFDNEDQWPVKHRMKSQDSWRKYEYDFKQKNNLFNLNSLYRRISNKPFIKGKKQYLEIIMMYFWLHDMISDEEDYWQVYLEKSLPN